MDFAQILDGIARPPADETPSAKGAATHPEFWRVLDGFSGAAGASRDETREAYRTNLASTFPVAPPRAAEPSLDPDDIAFELDLDSAATLDDLRAIRRVFARLNHPDRVAVQDRVRANARMTIANALIDAASARLSG